MHPPHPHQPGLFLPSWWNVRKKATVATLCTLWCGLPFPAFTIARTVTRAFTFNSFTTHGQLNVNYVHHVHCTSAPWRLSCCALSLASSNVLYCVIKCPCVFFTGKSPTAKSNVFCAVECLSVAPNVVMCRKKSFCAVKCYLHAIKCLSWTPNVLLRRQMSKLVVQCPPAPPNVSDSISGASG